MTQAKAVDVTFRASVVAVETGLLIAGRYRLVRRIGAGGMGEVWEAAHELTSKHVAVKVLNATYAKQPEVRARFLQEARAACVVRHPNVVQIHDVVEAPDGSPAMVMDLLSGESLGERCERRGALPLSEVAAFLAPAVDAIGAAHAMGVVHRDLKPDNLFLERQIDGRVHVRVLDFGIAKMLPNANHEKSGDHALTKTGAVLGTPYYMSPEQAFGEKDLDHRSDIYSLGLILHECLTGKRPTEADNFGQIMKIITTGAIPSLASIVPGMPSDLSDIVERMLTVRREGRPTLEEVHAVLSRHASAVPLAITFPPLPRNASSMAPSAGPAGAVDSGAPTMAAIEASSAPKLESTGNSFELSSSAPAGAPRRSIGRIMAIAAMAACTIVILGASLARMTARDAHAPAASTSVVVSAPPPADPFPAAPVASAAIVPTAEATVASPHSSARIATVRPVVVSSAKPRAAKPEAAAPPAAAAPAAAPQKTESVVKIADGPAPF